MTSPMSPSTLVPLLIEAARALLAQESWARAAESAAEAVRLSREGAGSEAEAEALFLLGRARAASGDREEALCALRECLELRESRSDLLAAAHTACEMGILYRNSGNLPAAREAFQHSLRLSAAAVPGLERARALEQLGIVERRTGELDSAIERLSEALRIYEALGERKRAADAREKLGNTYQNLGRLDEAMRHYEACLAVFTELRDSARLATTHNNIAGTLHQQGSIALAIEHFEKARSLFAELSMPRQLAVTLGNLGVLQLHLGRAEAAEDLLQQSLVLVEQLGDRLGQAAVLSNLALLHHVSGRFPEAIEWSDRTIGLKAELGQKEGLSKTLLVKANALAAIGRITEADATRRFAREAVGPDPGTESVADLCRMDCEYLLARGDLDGAEEWARQALELTRDRYPYDAADALRLLGTLARRRGDRDTARDYLIAAEAEFRRVADPYRLGLTGLELGQLFVQAEAFEAAAGRLREARQAFHGLSNHALEWRALLRLIEAEFELSQVQAETLLEEARTFARTQDWPEQLAEVEALWQRLIDRPAVAMTSLVDQLRGLEGALAEMRAGESLGGQPVSSFLLERPGMVGLCIDLEGVESGRQLEELTARFPSLNPSTLNEASANARARGRTERIAIEGRGLVALVIPVLALPRGLLCAVVRSSHEAGLRILLEATAILLAERSRAASDLAILPFSAPAGSADVSHRGARSGEHPSMDSDARGGRAKELAGFHGLVGTSQALRSLCRTIAQVAPTTASVLLEGESGTGKELVARAIHERSGRKGAFVAINCPSFPESLIEAELFGHEKGAFTGAAQRKSGQIELADGGTLFLDEVGDMSMSTQTKLLRFLEEREFLRVGGREPVRVDVRLIAATSRDLESELEAGRFRKDLYHRIKVVPLRMPPLRERREDVPLLLEHFLEELAPGRRFTPAAAMALVAYAWPGNVRELKNLVHRLTATSTGPWIGIESIPEEYRSRRTEAEAGGRRDAGILELKAGETLGARLMTIEGAILRAALEQCDWNQSQASRRLGLTESTLREKMLRYGIRRPESTRKAGRRPGSATVPPKRRAQNRKGTRRNPDARASETTP